MKYTIKNPILVLLVAVLVSTSLNAANKPSADATEKKRKQSVSEKTPDDPGTQ